MNPKSKSSLLFTALLAISCTLILDPRSNAARAPRSPEELNKSAAVILTGIVESAEVTVSGGLSQSNWNVALKIKVDSVEKGNIGASAGDVLDVNCWAVRRSTFAGPQGHDFIPAVGSTFKMWLQTGGDGKWTPLEPNGVMMLNGDAGLNFHDYEKQVLFKRLLIGLIVIALIAGVIFLVLKKNRAKDS